MRGLCVRGPGRVGREAEFAPAPGGEEPRGHLGGDDGRLLERVVAGHRAEERRDAEVVVPGLVKRGDVRGPGEQLGASVGAQSVAGQVGEVEAVEQSHRPVAPAQCDDRRGRGVAPRVDEVGAALLIGAGEVVDARMPGAQMSARYDVETPRLQLGDRPLQRVLVRGARGGDETHGVPGDQRRGVEIGAGHVSSVPARSAVHCAETPCAVASGAVTPGAAPSDDAAPPGTVAPDRTRLWLPRRGTAARSSRVYAC